MGLTEGSLRDWYSGIVFATDGESHRRLRRLVPSEDYEVAGQTWPAGTFLMCASITANRDGSVWKDPNAFIAERFLSKDCPKMMSFGAGAHFCLGAWLARMTLEEVVRAVSDLDPRPAKPLDTLEWIAPLGAYPSSLPIFLSGDNQQ